MFHVEVTACGDDLHVKLMMLCHIGFMKAVRQVASGRDSECYDLLLKIMKNLRNFIHFRHGPLRQVKPYIYIYARPLPDLLQKVGGLVRDL